MKREFVLDNFELYEKIKQKNSEAMLLFFNDIYGFIRYHVFKFIRANNVDTVDSPPESFINQVLLDLPYLDYTSESSFVYSLYKRSFNCNRKGGYSFLREGNYGLGKSVSKDLICSLYYTNDDKDEYLITDFIGIYDDTINDYIFLDVDKTEKIIDFCEKFLTKKQKEYFKLFMYGYTPSVIAGKLGISLQAGNSLKRKIKFALTENFFSIKNFLYDEFDFSCPDCVSFISENKNRIEHEKIYQKVYQAEYHKKRV